MKTFLLIISFLFIVSFGFAANPEGTWKSVGNTVTTLMLQTNGDNISGTIEDSHGKQDIPATKITNKEFTFNISVPEHDILIKYLCTLNDDGTMRIKITGPKNETTILLQKQ